MDQLSRRAFITEAARVSVLASLGAFAGTLPIHAESSPGPTPAVSASKASRPNIVILVADDYGWGDVGYHGSTIRTPNIDRLAGEGAALERFYVFPVCSPTRAGLLTGRNPLRHGITGTFKPADAGLSLDEHLLPETFRAAGYQTWMCGKWHLGGFTDPAYLPMNRGFDHFYGHLGGAIDYFQHVNRELNQVDWQRNGVTVQEEGYSTDLLTQEAIGLIEKRDPARPFLLYLPFNAAHGPHSAPGSWLAQYAGVGDRKARTHSAVVSAMDAAIGRLFEALDKQGIANNTLTVFFGDNGSQSSAGAGSNRPLRGEKGTVWDGGIRVPAWIHWPGVISSGARNETFLSVMDVFPTLAGVTGVPTGNKLPFDGRDRWEAIRAIAPSLPDRIVIGQGKDLAVLDGEWKYVELPEEGEKHLFRIGQDPSEEHDCAAEQPETLTKLAAIAHEIASDSHSTKLKGAGAKPKGSGGKASKRAPDAKPGEGKGGDRRQGTRRRENQKSL
ncbi:MAG: sulfatase-like hydrolase/transferase [Candidatus Hydrogenedentes bacterium]|nr:sulfatase-like hydrolase/transferase [Candidatus Hydrogenedentota bacterium]